MHRRIAVGIFGSFLQVAGMCAPVAQGDAKAFLVEQMTFVPRTLVQYCSASAPETGPSLERSLREFDVQIRTVSSPVMERLEAEGTLDVPAPAEFHANMAALKKRMLAEIAHVDPHLYCKSLVTKMRTIDAQAMVNSAEQGYLKNAAAAKASKKAGEMSAPSQPATPADASPAR